MNLNLNMTMHRVTPMDEADLDRHEAERLPVRLPNPIEPIEGVEEEHPWLWLLYAVGAVAACAASAFYPTPWFGG